MTEIELKKVLRNFHSTKTKIEILHSCLNIRNDESTKMQYDKESLRLKVFMDSMAILGEEENFVINTHLVRHYTWAETTFLFSKQYGNKNGKSERTLKRIQQKALENMLSFISSLPIDNYLNER